MGSTETPDRPARTRIRDAAIASVAALGSSHVSVRTVAAAAGVSPALVIHHYGSMDALREECDHHVAAEIRRLKSDALAEGPGLDPLAAIRRGHDLPLAAYLAAVLVDDSPAVARLVDELVDDAVGYLEQGMASGMIEPSEDPRARASVLMMWGLGSLVLHQHVRRLLGVDPTEAAFGHSPESARYVASVYEIYRNGLLTEGFAAHARTALDTPARSTTSEEAPQ